MDISVVVPVYNEEANIFPFLNRTIPVVSKIGKYEILFVLDPCKDQTEKRIQEFRVLDSNVKYLQLSRRFGQPAATYAGLRYAKGKSIVVIDVDLQDPPELILELYQKLKEGFEVVYATRRTRAGETLLKKIVASLGYRLINSLSEVEIPVNTGDYRIMSRKVVEELLKLNEKNAFLRGLVAYVGFSQSSVLYDRDARLEGKSKYNRFFGSLKIGLNGLVGFSAKPLTYMSTLGACIALFSFLFGTTYFVQKLLGFNLSPGFPTIVILISFLAGVQILSVGLLGEYISRIYDEVKSRPLFIVDKYIQ